MGCQNGLSNMEAFQKRLEGEYKLLHYNLNKLKKMMSRSFSQSKKDFVFLIFFNFC